MANTQNINVEKKEGSQVEITGEVPAETFESFRAGAVEKVASDTEVAGFRKGKTPADVLEKQVGEMPILEEMAERALARAYPEVLAEHKVDAIGRPSVQITKIAKGEPLGFKIITATTPSITLSDYKAAAAKVMGEKDEDVEVTDEEVENTITQVRQQLAAQQQQSKKEGEDQEPGEQDEQKKPELPELTDEYVQSLGDFKDVADFRAKIKENLKQEKQTKQRQKKRMATMDAIIAESTLDVPEVLIEEEINKMMHQFENDVSRMGLNFDEYLKHTGKTREDMRKEWRPDAEKNAKVQLILNKIATEESIKPDEERVKQEVDKLLEHYKDSDVSEDRARGYVEMVLTNEATFEFLENQGKKAK